MSRAIALWVTGCLAVVAIVASPPAWAGTTDVVGTNWYWSNAVVDLEVTQLTTPSQLSGIPEGTLGISRGRFDSETPRMLAALALAPVDLRAQAPTRLRLTLPVADAPLGQDLPRVRACRLASSFEPGPGPTPTEDAPRWRDDVCVDAEATTTGDDIPAYRVDLTRMAAGWEGSTLPPGIALLPAQDEAFRVAVDPEAIAVDVRFPPATEPTPDASERETMGSAPSTATSPPVTSGPVALPPAAPEPAPVRSEANPPRVAPPQPTPASSHTVALLEVTSAVGPTPNSALAIAVLLAVVLLGLAGARMVAGPVAGMSVERAEFLRRIRERTPDGS